MDSYIRTLSLTFDKTNRKALNFSEPQIIAYIPKMLVPRQGVHSLSCSRRSQLPKLCCFNFKIRQQQRANLKKF